MPLDHIIVLALENHSFDRVLGNLFAYRPDGGGIGTENPPSRAQTITDATTTPPTPYTQQATAAREVKSDPGHDLDNVLRQMGGPCLGFVTDFATQYPTSSRADRQEIMGVYPRGGLPVTHALAENFTVCDRWFASVPGPTWPNRFFLHSGTSLGHVDMPEGIFQPAVHCYDQTTLYDRLTEQRVSWKIYYGDMAQSLVMLHQLEHLDRYEELSRFFDEAKGPEKDFPQFSFIEPAYFGDEPNDQHPPHDVFRGEALLAQIYNALRANDGLWQRSLLVVVYDEHGGFYDHVDPPATVAPDGNTDDFDFKKLGVRVPATLISPWFERGVISDVFDHTSLLKFLVEKWGIGALGVRTGAPGTNSFGKYVLGAPRDTAAVLPRVDVPTYLPAQEQSELTSHQAALYAFSTHLAAKIDDRDTREQLLNRSPEAQQGASAAASVALDRFNAFLLDKGKLPASLDPGAMRPGLLRLFGVSAPKPHAPAGARGIWTGRLRLAFLACVALILLLNIGAALAGARFEITLPRPVTWLATVGVLVLLLVVAGVGVTGRTWGVFIDDRNKMSLSRFQLVIWTTVIVTGLMTAEIWNVLGPGGSAAAAAISIPPEILYVLGISGASFVAVPAILAQKATRAANPSEFAATAAGLKVQDQAANAIQHEGQVLTKSDPALATWTDLFRGDEVGNGSVIDMSKVQKFFFSMTMAVGYCAALFAAFAGSEVVGHLPPLDPTFAALLGVSNLAYLAYKAVPHSQDADDS